jgi:outer membrane protein OmpA-like peptidoglycan-associated protein
VEKKALELRRAILARRARFVASALATLSGAGCGGAKAEQTAIVVPIASSAASAGTAPTAEPWDAGPVAANPPPVDTDGDGVADDDDKCPSEPGAPPDGCPQIVPMVCLSIVIAPTLSGAAGFDPNDATLKPPGRAFLDGIVATLAAHPTMEVEIEGHVDATEVGAVALARAKVVQKYLLAQGVAARRLSVISYGATRPVDTNATAAGREKNRRVSFALKRP